MSTPNPLVCSIYPEPKRVSPYLVSGATNNHSLSHFRCDIDDLLNNLLDNSTNDINAKDVRDAVYTLWELATEALERANSISTVLYTNSNPIYTEIGGFIIGETFNDSSISDMWDRLLYPVIDPIVDFNFVQGINKFKEIDKEIGSSPSVQISYDITAKLGDYTIIDIELDGVTQPLTLNYNGNYNIPSPSNTNSKQTIVMTVNEEVNDGSTIFNNIGTYEIIVNWKHMILYGRTPGNTTSPDLDIITSGWLSNKNDYTNINRVITSDSTDTYVFIAIPTYYIGTDEIRIHLNGMYNNSFTEHNGIRNGVNYTVFISDYKYRNSVDFEIKK